MKRICIILLTLFHLISCKVDAEEKEVVISSSVNGVTYNFHINQQNRGGIEDLEKQTLLSFSQIVKKSHLWLIKEFPNKRHKTFNIEKVALRLSHPQYLYYEIVYSVSPADGIVEGRPLLFSVIMNPNGKIDSRKPKGNK